MQEQGDTEEDGLNGETIPVKREPWWPDKFPVRPHVDGKWYYGVIRDRHLRVISSGYQGVPQDFLIGLYLRNARIGYLIEIFQLGHYTDPKPIYIGFLK
jgi:hypothetical protein